MDYIYQKTVPNKDWSYYSQQKKGLIILSILYKEIGTYYVVTMPTIAIMTIILTIVTMS